MMDSPKLSDYLGFSFFWLMVKLCQIFPFWLLYRLSNGLFFILYYIAPFRRKIIIDNLSRSFPNKSAAEIKELYKKHLAYMCDMVLETLKGFTLNEQQLIQRWKVINPELLQCYPNQQIIIIAGHYSNWEWGTSLQTQVEHQCVYIYKPIRNSLINNFILKGRKNLAISLVKVKEFSSYFIKNTAANNAYCLIADQHPGGSKRIHWMPFLNQDTAFITGPEFYARKANLPVVYTAIERVKRGYYQVKIHLITDQPNSTQTGEITEKSMRILEQQIIANPQYWLWGHKRWKLKKQ